MAYRLASLCSFGLALVALTACDERDGAPSSPECLACGTSGAPSCAVETSARSSCLVELATYLGSTDLSISAVWSPLDDLVLSGGNGVLRLLELSGDPPGLHELDVFSEQGGRTAVAWSPDGRFALAASSDVRLFSIDHAAGRVAELGRPFMGHAGEIYALAWSPDGTRALSVGQDGVVRLLAIDADRASLSELGRFDLGFGKIYDVAFSPNGDAAVIGTEQSTLLVLSIDEQGALAERTRLVTDGWVTAVGWSPRGDAILGGTWLPCPSAELFGVRADGAGLVPTNAFGGHTSGVRVLEFGAGGELAVSAGHDDTFRLFRVAEGDPTLEHLATWDENAHGVHDVTFSPDGTRVVVAASHADRVTVLELGACLR